MKGEPNCAFALYGDGAANQGQIAEAMNTSALWDVPIIFVCENNHYGMGTAEWRGSKSPTFYKRGDYIPGIRVDGMDVLAVKQATIWAKQFVLENGPLCFEADTYRCGAVVCFVTAQLVRVAALVAGGTPRGALDARLACDPIQAAPGAAVVSPKKARATPRHTRHSTTHAPLNCTRGSPHRAPVPTRFWRQGSGGGGETAERTRMQVPRAPYERPRLDSLAIPSNKRLTLQCCRRKKHAQLHDTRATQRHTRDRV